ncbi:sigma-70 family RNA polymerase sigma factor [Nocardia vinacea]|uniref:RNA polymerase sigma factor n=1 Tax=Nocardia vinacea TaxID=96468 RepID=UPI003428BCE5
MSGNTDLDGDFRDFVQEHWLRLCGYITSLGAPPDVVDEAAQDAFLVMAREWHRLCNQAPKAYLFAVARNRAIKLIRKHRGYAAITEPLEAASVEMIDPRFDLVHVINRETLVNMLRRLPPRQRQAVELRYIYEFSILEVAEIMGVSAGTVKRNAHDGMQALQKLTEEGKEVR